MNIDDFIKQMQGQQSQQQEVEKIDEEKLDLFINRCREEKDETLFSLGQALNYKLNAAPMITFEEVWILPQVLKRIEERLNKGEV